MERLTLNLPEKRLNQLNNFYLENFGYDIHTQLQNFIYDEMKRCGDYSSENPPECPRPTIIKSRNKYVFRIYYPDNTSTEHLCETYDDAIRVWNEWSKYSFSKESNYKVLRKCEPKSTVIKQSKFKPKSTLIKHVRLRENNTYSVSKCRNGQTYSFGTFTEFETALKVRDFLEKHDWDTKYTFKNLFHKLEGCNHQSYSKYLLKIVEGELEV